MTTTCAFWCGKGFSWRPPGATPSYRTGNRTYCSQACLDAGRPLHPVSKPPGEPVCSVCGDSPAALDDSDGKHRCMGCFVESNPIGGHGRCNSDPVMPCGSKSLSSDPCDCPCHDSPAPGSALPLPGPPATCRHEISICRHCRVEAEADARDLAEARTALASAREEIERLRKERA